jgi:hypothetical protein
MTPTTIRSTTNRGKRTRAIDRRLLTVAALALAVLAAGCARVPPEAVGLSGRMGQDLATMQGAHASLVRQYFASMRDRAETFVDDVYRPYVIRATMDELDLVAELQRAVDGDSELDPLDLMEIYADEALAQIERFRDDLLEPIAAQERELLDEIDASYAALRTANAAITAHLASVSRVHDAQAELAGRAGLPDDIRERISGQAAAFSEQLGDLLARAESAESDLDDLPERIRELRDRF